MQNNSNEILGIDKSSGFALRVLILSMPAGIIFFLLGITEILSPTISSVSYLSILFFNTAFLLPLSAEIQQVKKYILAVTNTSDEEISLPTDLTEKEIQDLTGAINAMHKFWIDKIDILKNRTLTDAAVLDTLPDPLIMINQKGIIIGANLASRTLFSSSLTNNLIDDFITDETFKSALNKVLKHEKRNTDLNLLIKTAKGNNKYYTHINMLPWFSKGDTIAVITLYNLNKVLKLEQMQQDFVANASHELKTPLSIISGFIETLLTTAKNDEKARDKFLNIIKEQTVYMTALVEDLLILSKIELSNTIPLKDKISINPIIREIKTAMSLKFKEKELILKTKLPRLPQITADDHQITQIIQNLLDNAIKYALPKTDIIIETKQEENIPQNEQYSVAQGTAISISISNQSKEISTDELNRLTERFYRLQIHKNQNIKGTGLGLSIVAGIIKRHQGNLLISSEKGITTFKVFLPISQKEEN